MRRKDILPWLQKIQAERGFLTREDLEFVARELALPRVLVFSVATFYQRFSFYPPGKKKVAVCLGTACHVKGAARLFEALKKEFDLRESPLPGKYFHPQGLFSLEEVRCLGCCSVAPVVKIDDQLLGEMDFEKLKALLL